jgi:hypothetical protein
MARLNFSARSGADPSGAQRANPKLQKRGCSRPLGA